MKTFVPFLSACAVVLVAGALLAGCQSKPGGAGATATGVNTTSGGKPK